VTTSYTEQASWLADPAERARAQVAMSAYCAALFGNPQASAAERALAGRMMRAPVEWSAVLYAHICATSTIPPAAMSDAALTDAVLFAVNDLANGEPSA
jgi:hypothetical protein